MRFRLIDAAKKEFPVQRLCKVLGVSQSGYFAWKDRPACRRQHEDMVVLAHIRSAFALSNATYGSPRMTRELRDDGITIGRQRVARLMRENALKARQRRRFKRTTDSLRAFPVAPNLLNQDFNATGPNQLCRSFASSLPPKRRVCPCRQFEGYARKCGPKHPTNRSHIRTSAQFQPARVRALLRLSCRVRLCVRSMVVFKRNVGRAAITGDPYLLETMQPFCDQAAKERNTAVGPCGLQSRTNCRSCCRTDNNPCSSFNAAEKT